MRAHWTQTPFGLKLLLIGMTALLLAGLVLLVVGMARTAGEAARAARAGAALPVTLPPGARLVGMTATADRLLLRVEDAGGATWILVIDPDSGARTATLRLQVDEGAGR